LKKSYKSYPKGDILKEATKGSVQNAERGKHGNTGWRQSDLKKASSLWQQGMGGTTDRDGFSFKVLGL
jgi:hypothetical protein